MNKLGKLSLCFPFFAKSAEVVEYYISPPQSEFICIVCIRLKVTEEKDVCRCRNIFERNKITYNLRTLRYSVSKLL